MRSIAGVALAAVLVACGNNHKGRTPVDPGTDENVAAAAATITAADVQARVNYLASDELRGRNTPSPGLEIAAAYLAQLFHSFGLEPAGDSATFIQRYPLGGTTERVPNVVALVRGSDPALRDSYVIVSAHMDHVGVGAPDASGDSIYNGADDDASGTAAITEIAQAFAALETKPRRSVVFLAVSGEEKGLHGSRYFAESPSAGLPRAIANINLDMISRNSPDSISAIGLEYSSLGPLLHEVRGAHPELQLTVAPDLWPAQQLFFRSDHYSFARKGIPAIFLFAGLHADYHRPSDEPERIDADKAARVARLAFYLAHAIASRDTAPTWTQAGLQAIR